MATIAIVTDTSSDLQPEEAEAAGIRLVPLTVSFGAETFEAGTELRNDEFYAKLTAPGAPFPRTAAPNPGQFEAAYRDALDGGADGVVCVTISGKLSATHSSAVQGAEAFDDGLVEVVDTRTTTHALAMIAVQLAERSASGATITEVTELAADLVGRTDIIFAVDTLEYLQKGGRIGRASALLGSVLAIKPILRTVDGEVASADRRRTAAKARARLLELAAERPLERATVLHTVNPHVDAFREALLQASGLEAERIGVGLTGPVAGAHVGPGMIGVSLILAS